ncbi:filamentous hemagglutinin family outer membrane protein [Plakobranchus ocellatus]|uniref:Filamentous hemagglutinin family outer membrane protein n=1 Tax=Plakobranchus ocellatus TaxID=259542 RepID=A0AAV3ZQG4_9GAST|nr:filamentous hemagglutinin family outer membrane protein [Plakobranchus ocellatus]
MLFSELLCGMSRQLDFVIRLKRNDEITMRSEDVGFRHNALPSFAVFLVLPGTWSTCQAAGVVFSLLVLTHSQEIFAAQIPKLDLGDKVANSNYCVDSRADGSVPACECYGVIVAFPCLGPDIGPESVEKGVFVSQGPASVEKGVFVSQDPESVEKGVFVSQDPDPVKKGVFVSQGPESVEKGVFVSQDPEPVEKGVFVSQGPE